MNKFKKIFFFYNLKEKINRFLMDKSYTQEVMDTIRQYGTLDNIRNYLLKHSIVLFSDRVVAYEDNGNISSVNYIHLFFEYKNVLILLKLKMNTIDVNGYTEYYYTLEKMCECGNFECMKDITSEFSSKDLHKIVNIIDNTFSQFTSKLLSDSIGHIINGNKYQ